MHVACIPFLVFDVLAAQQMEFDLHSRKFVETIYPNIESISTSSLW